MRTLLLIGLATAIAVGAGMAAVFCFWRLRSALRLRRAGRRQLRSSHAVIWHDPGPIEELDMRNGPGGRDGAPMPPFVFVEEHFDGSQPCISVRDARRRIWRVKWGSEVQCETLATRLAWAAGYFVETTYFVREGRIEGAENLQRAGQCVDAAGAFRDGRFELDEHGVVKHFDEHGWAWNDNPFVGTRELNGLKVVMMWVSNWDAKDRRDVARGSNMAIFEHRARTRAGRTVHEARYLVIDWGGTMGRWGSIVARGRWDCAGFSAQTESFVTGVERGFVRFGYTGQRTADIAEAIPVEDVRWLITRLGRLRDAQIADAVEASGGTPEEVMCFTAALRRRLDRLAEVASTSDAGVQPFLVR